MLKQITLLIGVFILFIAASVAMERAFSPTFQNCIASHQNSEQSRTAEQNPSGLKIIPADYVRCSARLVMVYQAAITAVATLIIAAFTGTLWIATSRQAELTREALAADKRAFVFAKGIGGFWEIDHQTGLYNWRLRVLLENSGETPTSQMTMFTGCELRNAAHPISHIFDDDPSNVGTGLIGPKSTTYGGLAPQMHISALTPQDLRDVQEGRKFLYVWGWIRYFDVFPGTEQHLTRFAWAVVVQGDPFSYNPAATSNTLAFNNIYMQRGNCADEECVLQNLA